MTDAPRAAAVVVLACPKGDLHLVLTDASDKPIAECALPLDTALAVGHKICMEVIEARVRELQAAEGLGQDGTMLQ